MHVARASHAWFIFNLITEISLYLQILSNNIYTHRTSHPTRPLLPIASLVYLLGEPASLLVVTNAHHPHPCPWAANNCPTLCFAPFTLHTPQFKLQYLHSRHQKHWSSSSGIVWPISRKNFRLARIVFPVLEIKTNLRKNSIMHKTL